MSRPLEGFKVVEVAMWAFVPSCGGVLSDLGADVIKVEPPSGDPLRGLQIGGMDKSRVDLSWESYNRGKRSITLDLKTPEGREVLMKLVDGADVFLTNLLLLARKKMGIDAETIRARFPGIVYAAGSGTGPAGPEAAKGGYDSITYWARSGISSTMTEDGAPYPVPAPGPAFGDTMSGAMLAGAICAALAKRERTGEGSQVDVSLLGTAMWSMQRLIGQSTMDGVLKFPKPPNPKPFNVLVHTYRTSDDRFVALCMLQADKYWHGFCEAAGRPDLAANPDFATDALRRQNIDACMPEMVALFAARTVDEWRAILGRQDGQWDVVQHVGEIHKDLQVVANDMVQTVDYGDGSTIPLVALPWMFGGETMKAKRSPDLGADSDSILESLGYDEDAIIDLKVKGVVF
jgi:crotonobetainyl-CoA:carnitine CoA-transferase CaiB-like acyl-CoA transferase